MIWDLTVLQLLMLVLLKLCHANFEIFERNYLDKSKYHQKFVDAIGNVEHEVAKEGETSFILTNKVIGEGVSAIIVLGYIYKSDGEKLDCAVKIENFPISPDADEEFSFLKTEFEIYGKFNAFRSPESPPNKRKPEWISEVYYHGETTLGEKAVNVMFMELLNVDLEKASESIVFSLKTILQIGQILSKCVGDFHRNGYLLVDLKPENIMLGYGKEAAVRVIDFGAVIEFSSQAYILSPPYSSPQTLKLIVDNEPLILDKNQDAFTLIITLVELFRGKIKEWDIGDEGDLIDAAEFAIEKRQELKLEDICKQDESGFLRSLSKIADKIEAHEDANKAIKETLNEYSRKYLRLGSRRHWPWNEINDMLSHLSEPSQKLCRAVLSNKDGIYEEKYKILHPIEPTPGRRLVFFGEDLETKESNYNNKYVMIVMKEIEESLGQSTWEGARKWPWLIPLKTDPESYLEVAVGVSPIAKYPPTRNSHLMKPLIPYIRKSSNILRVLPGTLKDLYATVCHNRDQFNLKVGQFTIHEFINWGSHSLVFLGRHESNNLDFAAIKIQEAGDNRLRHEQGILTELKEETTHFPVVRDSVWDISLKQKASGKRNLRVDTLILEYLSPSLEIQKDKYSLTTLFNVGIQAVTAIEQLHKRTKSKNNITLSNILTDQNGKIKLVGFGHTTDIGQSTEAASSFSAYALSFAPKHVLKKVKSGSKYETTKSDDYEMLFNCLIRLLERETTENTPGPDASKGAIVDHYLSIYEERIKDCKRDRTNTICSFHELIKSGQKINSSKFREGLGMIRELPRSVFELSDSMKWINGFENPSRRTQGKTSPNPNE